MVIETENTKIMIDAGLSYKKMCEHYGEEIIPEALFISHEHADHISGAGILGRKTGCPIYLAEPCYKAKQEHDEKFFKGCEIKFISGGDDSAASVGFIVTELSTNKKFGFLTDTGLITPLIRSQLDGCDAYFLECDYDTESLEKYAEYDEFLKDRIKSPIGHLSNQQSLEYIHTYLNLEKVAWIILGHLSQNTNSPELLKEQCESKLPKKYWNKVHIGVASLKLEV
jgi:phosphoribosyl 1,2-cyclic phosphodiesterase